MICDMRYVICENNMAKKFVKNNVLVLGGAGFIGSHLCEELLRNNRVICMDNFISGDELNIDHLLRNPEFELIRHDINEPFDLEQFSELKKYNIKAQGVQEVYNLAVPTSPKNFEKYKIETARTNSIGTLNALETALKYKAKFFQASSSVVYGPRLKNSLYFKEDYIGHVNNLSPRACYDEGKRFAESLVETYRQVYGLEIRIGRIFRTYGPRMKINDGQMIPDFITNALDNNDLVIYGDKGFHTSLVYIDDVISAIIKLMSAPDNDLGPVNIGSDNDLKLIDVAQKIIKMNNSTSKIVFKEMLVFMSPLGLPDISKAKSIIEWIPLTTLDDGLQKTIDYTMATKSLIRPKY